MANTIFKQNAGLPVERHLLAQEIGTSVNSSTFVTKLAASEQYGLTQGRYRDEDISLTELGLSVVASKTSQELQENMRRAAYYPPQFDKLRNLLKNQELPNTNFLKGLLVRDVGIHPELTEEYITIYKENARFVETYSGKMPLSNGPGNNDDRFTTNTSLEDGHIPISQEKEPKYVSKTCVLIHAEEEKALALDIANFFISLNLPISLLSIVEDNIQTLDPGAKDFALILLTDNTEMQNKHHYLDYSLGLGRGLCQRTPLILHIASSGDSYLNKHPYVDQKDIVLSKDTSNMKVGLLFKLTELGNLKLSF
jgi:hypothetical protein